ncbi:uncharacterized protein LOC132698314 [Cylas formicarius]|uniref:uncharacterized protein LOC132698314 n=1 Tax=Cylas formicarius TaxID=197179 RepID=UPI0029588606|nr:uncharacterized protein LOC132698314 [Cylas formicarius]
MGSQVKVIRTESRTKMYTPYGTIESKVQCAIPLKSKICRNRKDSKQRNNPDMNNTRIAQKSLKLKFCSEKCGRRAQIGIPDAAQLLCKCQPENQMFPTRESKKLETNSRAQSKSRAEAEKIDKDLEAAQYESQTDNYLDQSTTHSIIDIANGETQDEVGNKQHKEHCVDAEKIDKDLDAKSVSIVLEAEQYESQTDNHLDGSTTHSIIDIPNGETQEEDPSENVSTYEDQSVDHKDESETKASVLTEEPNVASEHGAISSLKTDRAESNVTEMHILNTNNHSENLENLTGKVEEAGATQQSLESPAISIVNAETDQNVMIVDSHVKKSVVDFAIHMNSEPENQLEQLADELVRVVKAHRSTIQSRYALKEKVISCAESLLKIMHPVNNDSHESEVTQGSDAERRGSSKLKPMVLSHGPSALVLVKQLLEEIHLRSDVKRELELIWENKDRSGSMDKSSQVFVKLIADMLASTRKDRRSSSLSYIDLDHTVLKSSKVRESASLFMAEYLTEGKSITDFTFWSFLPRVFHDYVVDNIFPIPQFANELVEQISDSLGNTIKLSSELNETQKKTALDYINSSKSAVEQFIKNFLCYCLDDDEVVQNVIEVGRFVDANIHQSSEMLDNFLQELADNIICGMYKKKQEIFAKTAALLDYVAKEIFVELERLWPKATYASQLIQQNLTLKVTFVNFVTEFFTRLEREERYLEEVLVNFLADLVCEMKWSRDNPERENYLQETFEHLVGELQKPMILRSQKGRNQIKELIFDIVQEATAAVRMIKKSENKRNSEGDDVSSGWQADVSDASTDNLPILGRPFYWASHAMDKNASGRKGKDPHLSSIYHSKDTDSNSTLNEMVLRVVNGVPIEMDLSTLEVHIKNAVREVLTDLRATILESCSCSKLKHDPADRAE